MAHGEALTPPSADPEALAPDDAWAMPPVPEAPVPGDAWAMPPVPDGPVLDATYPPPPPLSTATDTGTGTEGAAPPPPLPPPPLAYDLAGPPPASPQPVAPGNLGPLLFAGLAVLAAIASLAWVASSGLTRRALAPAVLTHPASWDPRVQFAVDFVEQQKGMGFRHPVQVSFLPVPEFERLVTEDPDDTDDAEPSDAARAAQAEAQAEQVGMLRALGLVTGSVDLDAQGESLASAGILGFYDPDTEEAYVRGDELTPMVQAVLVHELTHAWQDQYHDLSRLGDETDSERWFALRAVAEGDATLVEQAWHASRPAGEQQAREDEEDAGFEEYQERTEQVASIFTVFTAAPYGFGSWFLAGLRVDGGPGRITQAFAAPPANSAVVLRPWTFNSGYQAPRVEAPPVPDGRESVDEDTFGALLLYLMLSDRIDPHAALAASDAWVADRYRVEKDESGRVCVDGRIRGTGPTGAETIATALDQWDAAFPGGEVTVTRDGSEVRLEACDPGAGAAVTVPDRAAETVDLPVVRLQVWATARAEGVTPAVAECIAHTFVDLLAGDEAVRSGELTEERFLEVLQTSAFGCRI